MSASYFFLPAAFFTARFRMSASWRNAAPSIACMAAKPPVTDMGRPLYWNTTIAMAKSHTIGEEEFLAEERRFGRREDGNQLVERHGAEADAQHLEEELDFSRTVVEVGLERVVFRDNRQGHARGGYISNPGDEHEAVDDAGDGLDVGRRRHGVVVALFAKRQ